MKTFQFNAIFPHSGWGGIETVLIETTKRLNQWGHHSTINAKLSLGAEPFEKIDGVEVYRYSSLYESDSLVDDFISLEGRIARENFDLAHIHSYYGRMGLTLYRLLKRYKKPYIVTLHAVWNIFWGKKIIRGRSLKSNLIAWKQYLFRSIVTHFMVKHASAVLCLGKKDQEFILEKFPSIPKERVFLFRNGIDVKHFEGGSNERFRSKYGIPFKAPLILLVGRIDPQKNQPLAVEAMFQVRQQCPEARMVFLGHVTDVDYYNYTLSLIKRLDLKETITIIPGVDYHSTDLIDAYAAADFCVLPSYYESFGIAILEAFSVKKPVIASRVDGIPDICSEGEDSLLFESNCVEQFAEKILYLLENPEVAKCFGEEGYKKTQAQYSWDIVTEELLQIYRTALDKEHVLKDNDEDIVSSFLLYDQKRKM